MPVGQLRAGSPAEAVKSLDMQAMHEVSIDHLLDPVASALMLHGDQSPMGARQYGWDGQTRSLKRQISLNFSKIVVQLQRSAPVSDIFVDILPMCSLMIPKALMRQ